MKSNVFVQNRKKTRILVFGSLLIAISAILKILFEVYIPLGGFPSLRINLNSIPIILSGLILGPIPGFIVGVLSDLICYIIKPNGPLFLGFTLSSGLTGLIPGVFWVLIKDKKIPGFKWINLLFSLIALAILFSTNTLAIKDGIIYYMDDPLNLFVLSLFLLLIIIFSVYPFVAKYILRKVEAEESENILVIITFEQIINSVILNTLWLTILYGQAWMVLLPARIITNVFLIPFYTIIIALILKILPKNFKKI